MLRLHRALRSQVRQRPRGARDGARQRSPEGRPLLGERPAGRQTHWRLLDTVAQLLQLPHKGPSRLIHRQR
eukprot:7444054-Heterocapsa_arctica.AAC.1